MKYLYMDNAATSYPKPPEVAETVRRHILEMTGNAGRGNNHSSTGATAVIEQARKALANLFHILEPERIAFTLNVTQAINYALQGLLKPGDHVITSSMEHNAVARPLHVLKEKGILWSEAKCDYRGQLDVQHLTSLIRPQTKLICMMHASNVVGTIMPIETIGKVAREHQIIFMVDAAQTAGCLDLDVEHNNIDILAFTGHKSLLGPQGVGGLYLRSGLNLQPIMQGGTGSVSESFEQPDFMPDMLESGTMNLPGIAGLKAAVDYILHIGITRIHQRESHLLETLWQSLQQIPRLKLYGMGDGRYQTPVVSFTMDGMRSLEVARRLDEQFQIITRAGLHCAVLAHRTIGTEEDGTCRLSPGYFTSKSELGYVAHAIRQIAQQK